MQSTLKRVASVSLAALLGTAGGLAVTAAPAYAAPGDAHARGVIVDLSAEVLGISVIEASAVIGSVDAPPAGGTDTETLLDITLPGAIGVAADGTVLEVSATRGPISSSASSSVADVSLDILGVNVLTASAVEAAVSCPFVGPQTADTTLTGLTVFGLAEVLIPNGPSLDVSAAVTVPGLVGAMLDVSLSRIETVTADSAAAATIVLTASLSGLLLGFPVVIPVGEVIIAEATCERPAAPAPPTASSIDPDSGPQSGGQVVTITGSGFVPGDTAVTFDGLPATDVVVDPSGTSLTAVTPAHAPGVVDVVVTTDGGSTDPLAYTYLADGSDAVVTGLDPDFGPTSGGTTVTITGSGFTGATGVTFDGVAGTGFAVNPAGTEITVVTPPGAAGPADVVLVFPAGTADAGIFTYVPPTIDSVVPDSGPNTGGTTVTVTGSGFTGATDVTFGGVPGTDLVVDPSGMSLTVVTPPGPVGPVDVVVVLPGDDAVAPDGFTYVVAPPTASSIDPDSGPQSGGQVVTITGSGFVPGDTAVTFDGLPATDVVVDPSGTSLTAVTPAHAPGVVDVVVTTDGGSTDPLAYTYLADGSDAVVTGLDPDFGPTSGGTTVTITGSGFTGATGVTFDGVAGTGFAVNPAGTEITVVTPPGAAGPADVVLVFPAGTADAGIFTYVPPTIDSVVPDSGPNTGGTTVTVTGSGFTGATDVTFGGVPGTDLVVDPSGMSLTVVTPPGPVGPVDVVVVLPGDDAVAPDGFTYVVAPPTASSIDPDSGPQSGGQVVTITGSGFVPGDTAVTFDGLPATDVVVDPSGTSLTAVTPAHAPGVVDVVVTTDGGSTDPLAYTYLADGSDAVVTDLDPDFGPTSGGTTVTITGSGFTGATGVTFDGVAGTGFAVNPAGTEITVVTPPGAAGPADVVLVFPAGTADAGIFTYVPPTIDSVVPDSGPNTGGTTVTVTGSGFTGATDVTFGGVPGTDLVVDPSGMSLTVVTPPGPVGPVDVVVVLPGDDAVAPDGFTYSGGPAPVIDSVDPGQGPANGGTTVVVGGSGFIPGQTTVTICGKTIPANKVTVNSSGTSLSFVTPPCDVKHTTITVTTPNGTSNEIAFRYVGLPVTGSATTNLITSGGALVVLGISLLLLTRRRANRA
ncbi:IPT/TIG domain-containing protein [Solwaraspora sp. WMMA2059]|uniref:IPT/TIG domain-containing protein n=1 Tax=Solwaraspora sp. WMMA2059 TaxID=3015160 RepID=UPI00248D0B69|nr:IPT/TIG domain-containing protein [Solwaraspora sp. WMMA2059]WBB97934.1 IPT/TIG domain-containing protein [Solwaraspora sp. WMMA2059]